MTEATYAPVNRIKQYVTSDDFDCLNAYIDAGLPVRRDITTSNNGGSFARKVSFNKGDIFDQLIPVKNSDKIKEAIAMRHCVSVIQAIVNFKLSLYTKQFSIVTTGRGNSQYQDISKKWNLKKIQKQLHDDLLTTDNCILLWKTAGPRSIKPQMVMRLNPSEADVIEVNGKDFLSVMLDREFYKKLEDKIRHQAKYDPELIKEIERIPDEWFIAARKGQPLSLKRSDGYRWIIEKKYAVTEDNGLCKPSMMSIFSDAHILRMLQLAEYTTAFNLKNLILHVRQGELVKENEIVNKKFMATKAKINALRNVLNTFETSLRLYTDHTVKLDYISPPIEIFKKDKYESAYFRVINIWSGLPNALFAAGDSKATIGSAFVALKRPNIEGQENRDIIADVLKQFMASIRDVDVDRVPKIVYDNDALRDERLKLDILKFLRQSGAMDNATMQRDFGYNPATINVGQKDDIKNKDTRMPVFEASQSIVAEKVHGIKSGGGSNPMKPKESKGGQRGADAAPVGDEATTGTIPRSDR